jgi:hypothetical protein
VVALDLPEVRGGISLSANFRSSTEGGSMKAFVVFCGIITVPFFFVWAVIYVGHLVKMPSPPDRHQLGRMLAVNGGLN